MNQNNQAIAQLLAMSQQPQQQQPLLAPPVASSTGGGGTAPMQDPMQGFAQMAQSAAGAFRDGRMMGRDSAFPSAPLNLGGQPGGVFGLLKNPFANYTKGGGLF